jgi:hypothetical protein
MRRARLALLAKRPGGYSAGLPLLLLVATMALATEPGWKTKPPAQWTPEDAKQVLSMSPWVKRLNAVINRRLTEDQLREGGQLGQPRGVGNEGVDPKGSGPVVTPNIFTGAGGDDRSIRSRPQDLTLGIRWESALPVRLAELTMHEVPPTLEGDGYQIAVFGIPGNNFKEDPKQLGEPLKKTALLKRIGKKDVRPERVEVYQRQDGMVAIYLFPLSAEISKNDTQVEFEAQIGRISVVHIFDLRNMEFQGKLEL